MKKFLSLCLAGIILCSLFGAMTVSAADLSNCVNITLSGTQKNTLSYDTIRIINEKRATNGLPALINDRALNEIAQKRAAEVMLYGDQNDTTLPSGAPVTDYLPTIGTTESTQFGYYFSGGAASLATLLSALETATWVQSVGLAVFEYEGVSTYYALASAKPAAEMTTVFEDSTYAPTIPLNITYISNSFIQLIRVKGYYDISCSIKSAGLYGGMIEVANEGVTFVSSNPKVFKIKNNLGYIKKSGQVEITAKTKNGTVFAQDSIKLTTDSVAPRFSKASSPKKAQLYAKWEKNITNADGYQLQYSTSSKFAKKQTKTITIKGKKNCAKTIKKLKRKKKYYVRVRAYINQGNGEKMYSKWSKKKTVTIK